MRISPHIYSCKVPFGDKLGSFVNLFLVCGERNVLIDAGISGAEPVIAGMLAEAGLSFSRLDEIIVSHAHPDHIGALRGLKRKYGVPVAAPEKNLEWIEDVYSQLRERPAPRFVELVEGSVKVDRTLKDGDRVDLGGGASLLALETPGHCTGQIALFHERDGALIAADAIPRPGKIPIYDDPDESLETLLRLKGLPGVELLLSSWDAPHSGMEDVFRVYDEARAYIDGVGALVRDAVTRAPGADESLVAATVFPKLGLPDAAYSPLFSRTIKGYMVKYSKIK